VIFLLKPAELLLRAVNRARRGLYRRGVLRARKLPRPVVSVGNIAIGGAGKTPAVIAIARDLTARGFRVAVLTRGYGRSSDVTGVMTSHDAAMWGDEPVLIARSADKAIVIVGSNRFDNATRYLADNDCDVFLLDDGFQHQQLARDLDLVVEAPSARFQREGQDALRDARFVIPRRLRVTGGEAVRGKRVFAFAGLADNEQFFATLRTAGATVAGTLSFPDHHGYGDEDKKAIRAAAARCEAELIVTTEKDAVKLPGADDIATIGIEMEIEPAVLDAIAELVERARSHRQA
jgi:tetraacyldisaccharide 4'-kinase